MSESRRSGSGVERSQPSGGGLGLDDRELVAEPVGGLATDSDDLQWHLAGPGPAGRGRLEGQPDAAGLVELVPPRRQVEDRDPEDALFGDDGVAGRQLCPVDDDEDVGQHRLSTSAEPGALAHIGGQQPLEVGHRGRDHAGGPDTVAFAG